MSTHDEQAREIRESWRRGEGKQHGFFLRSLEYAEWLSRGHSDNARGGDLACEFVRAFRALLEGGDDDASE